MKKLWVSPITNVLLLLVIAVITFSGFGNGYLSFGMITGTPSASTYLEGDMTWGTPNSSPFYPPFLKDTAVIFMASKSSTASVLFDASNNHNNGTINGATWGKSASGIWNLYFPGSGNNIITLADSATLQVTNFTILVWLTPTLGRYQEMVAKGTTESAHYGFEWGLTNANKMRTFIGNGTSTDTLNGTTTIPSVRFLAGVTWTDSTLLCTQYINGVESEHATLLYHIAHTTDAVKIGYQSNRYQGYMDVTIVILNRALTATEMADVYEYENNW